MSETTVEARRFTIDPHAIMSLIRAQSGSLQKAMLEAVANSMDAGAKRIDVTLTPDSVEITDNGRGLSKVEEIYEFFERFGFDHSQLDRQVGRFGVGRGQLFCFGVNTWRTNEFEMEIDIKNKGLDYELKKGLPKHKGMSITIALDETLQASEQLAIEEEFRHLVRFSSTPIYFNGEKITEDVNKLKWNFENEDAWFQIKKGGSLSVYSQGLFVKDLWGHEFGVGGRIITKPGKALEQNLARNDLLVKDCEIWKRIRPEIVRLAKPFKENADKDVYMTPSLRKNMAREALTADGAKTLAKAKIFTLSNNRHVTLDRVLSTGFISTAPMLDQAADRLMQRKQAMVLATDTLERFGVDTLEELRRKLKKALESHYAAAMDSELRGGYDPAMTSWKMRQRVKNLNNAKLFDKVEDMPFDTELSFTTVPYKDLTEEERAVAYGLRRNMSAIAYCVARALEGQGQNTRRLEFFEDNGSVQACTDGATTVWINRKVMLSKAKKGAPGYMELISLLVHEQLHQTSSQTQHAHPPEFYEDFHNILLDGDVAKYALSAFSIALRHGLKPTSKKVSELEKAGVEVDMPLGTGEAIVADGGQPKKKRGRKPGP